MSLEIYAKHIAEKGRGPDDTLVHMSRDEVKSLNELAMAHGGQLTINPETGLPEAGFLSAILPMVAGAAITGLSGGTLGPVAAGLMVGAGSYALNPKAGLMGALSAGMGAYGGAGLGNALAAQGVSEATAAKLAQDRAYQQMQTGVTDLGREAAMETARATGPAQLATAQSYVPQMQAASGDIANYANNIKTGITPDTIMGRADMMGQGIKSLGTEGGMTNLYNRLGGGMGTAQTVLASAAPAIAQQPKDESTAPVVDKDMGQRYSYSPGVAKPLPAPDVPSYDAMLTQQGNFGKEQNYYPTRPAYTPISNDAAKNLYHYANGGPVESMSNANAIGTNTGFPQAYDHTHAYATPYQTPISQNVLTGPGDTAVDPYTGEQRMAEGGEAGAAPAYTYDAQAQKYIGSAPTAPMGAGTGEGIGAAMSMAYNPQTQQFTGGNVPTGQIYLGGGQFGLDEATKRAQAEAAAAAASGMASGGLSDARYNLGGYSDGGRLLRGPGDGVSDSIPAMIGKKQPARLADGEFVVPARIVSEIGNGSTEAGARKLYAMMDRVQSARRQTVGKGKVAKNSRADKYLPA
jgi:hypothetical protein